MLEALPDNAAVLLRPPVFAVWRFKTAMPVTASIDASSGRDNAQLQQAFNSKFVGDLPGRPRRFPGVQCAARYARYFFAQF